MKADDAKILVIGAGVNGSACAARLHNGGINVTVLARGKRYDDIRNEGIIIENPLDNKRSVTQVPVINSLGPDDIYDYILVVIRKNQLSELLPVLAKNKSQNMVFMFNNLAGADEYENALGKGRVMMGFVNAGGRKEGNIIRAMASVTKATKHPVPFGEVNGAITPRLERLVSILNRGGYKAKASTGIVDYLATHAAGVALIAKLVLKYNLDVRALAKSSSDLKLFLDAMRESYAVIKAAGYRIVPKSTYIYAVLPRFLLVLAFRALLSSKMGEVGLAYHVSQAPDEVECLAKELEVLVEKSKLPAPAMRKILDMN